jgi:hypothetical protein
MRKLPKMCKGPEATFVTNPVNTANLATAKVGFGFVRSTSTCTRKFEICRCSSGIFLYVDRSKALSHNNFGHSTKILLSKHCLSLRRAEGNNCGQWNTIDAKTFKDFSDRIGTKTHFASVRHPESNGLV